MKRLLCLLGTLVTALPLTVRAQGSQPLRKTDLIRLLSNPLISKREVADLIRRNCVSFRPTPRDWTDLRGFGADSEVLGSIGGCASTRAATLPPLTAAWLTERVSIPAGATAIARIQVKRADVPQAGIPLVLRGSSRIPGGPIEDARAMTAAGGIAAFQFPAGRMPGTYRLAVVTGTGFALPGAPPLEVLVSPATPAVVELQPARVELRDGERGALSLLVTLRDSLGTAVADEAVALEGDPPDMGIGRDQRSTDSLGRATFVVERSAIRRAGKLTVWVRGRTLGSVDVSRLRLDVAASATTDFVSGVGQPGMAGSRLAEPLVFRVRTSEGAPLKGKVVKLRAVNAEIPSDSLVTDSLGLVRVEVTMGKQAGAALITATVDSVQKQAGLVVAAAGPVGVVLERDGARLNGGSLRVPVGTAFQIRVSPQDAYGNPVSTTDLARLIQQLRGGFNVRSRLLKVTGVEAAGASALVTFTPRGVGEVNLSIAGATVSVQVVAAR